MSSKKLEKTVIIGIITIIEIANELKYQILNLFSIVLFESENIPLFYLNVLFYNIYLVSMIK